MDFKAARVNTANARRRLTAIVPRAEWLEGRRLLSFLQPFGNKFDRVRSGGVLDLIAVSGPGQVFTRRIGRGEIAIGLSGTTQDSQVTITSLGARPGEGNRPLKIGKIRIQTGRLGSFQGLTTADLLGGMSTLQGIVNSLQFDSLGPAARITVIGNLGQLTVNEGISLGRTGQIYVSNDLTGSLSVTRDVSLDGGILSVGRDLSGTVTIGGNLALADGGRLTVGRNLGATASGATDTLTGNLTVGSGSGLAIGGNLSSLTVTGVIQGKGSDDIVVGDDLGQLTVLGGGNNLFSLTDVGIDVSKSILGLDIRNGITGSLITAGILINGGTPGTGSNGWNIGPDGPVAVFDSEILAGLEIENVTIGGDVKSDLPTNPTGRPTRIVAGEYPQNSFVSGGTIDKFQIIGNLIDSVVAASVEPYNGTYPEPAAGPNSTAPPFADPNVPMSIVLAGGSINPSFASSSGSPTKLTVTGAVVSNTHVYTADYAGIFAANTAGVKVGTPST